MADHSPDSTAELIVQARTGDEHATNELVARYLPRLTKWATGRLPADLRSARDTGDLVQDAIVNALRNLDTFEARDEGSFLFYLARAVTNRIKDLYRSKGRQPAREEMPMDVESSGPSPLDLAIGAETRAWYERGVASLGQEDQVLVFLALELGLTHQEIATQLGKPSADAARMAVKRAVEHLATAMGSRPT